MTLNNYKKEHRQRAFEILLDWEGRCNASTLSRLFGIDRNNAGKDIRDYMSRFPGMTHYDGSDKAYRPTSAFRPHLSRGEVAEYQALTKTGSMPNDTIDFGVSPMASPPKPLFRCVMESIRSRQALKIQYRSWNHPEGTSRVVHPHALAFSGIRWHMRAYDENKASYRDFHLGRVQAFGKAPAEIDYYDGRDDHGWHTFVELRLVPNPRLSLAEQVLVAHDYFMRDGEIRLHCRLSLCHYALLAFSVNLDADAMSNPRKSPLVLLNKSEIEEWLFDGKGPGVE